LATAVESSINFGIINSVTKLHLVGVYTESSTMHGSMNIKFKNIVPGLLNNPLTELTS